MQRKVFRRALLAVPAVALGLTPGIASAQGTSATGWRTAAIVSNQPANGTAFYSVAAAGPGHAWAVGITVPNSGTGYSAPFVEAWNGSAWSPVTLPPAVLSTLGTSAFLETVAAGGAKDAWAFDLSGHWLHFDGTAWTAGKVPGQAFVESSLTIGTRAVWAFGWSVTRSGPAPYAAFRAGTGWKRTQVPGHGHGVVVGASAVTGRDIWAVIRDGVRTSELLHWYAGHWHAVSTMPAVLRAGSLSSVLARSDENVWVGGAVKNSQKGSTEAVGHWNGHRWNVVTLHAAATVAKWRLIKMVTDGSGGIWALGLCEGSAKCGNGRVASRLWHEGAGKWGRPVQPKLTSSQTILLSLAATGKSVWAAGVERVSKSVNGLVAVWGPTP